MVALPENHIAAGQKPTAILAAHNGALGDFLCCWPGMLAIARHFGGQTPSGPPLYFLGRAALRPWVLPLGYTPCPPDLRAAAESLYAAQKLPAVLANSKIFWFCLDKPPNFPCLHVKPPQEIIPLPILRQPPPPDVQSCSNAKSAYSHVRRNLKASLETFGLSWPPDWREAWQALFGGWQGRASKEIALLPGSGHQHKEWPLHYFTALADMLARQGWEPVFIIGEAERERGLRPPTGLKWEDPSPPLILAGRLRKVRAIVSNDAGPAHLAGMYGVPGIVLFGPTPPETWGVPGMANLNGHGLYLSDETVAEDEPGSLDLKLNFSFKPNPLPFLPCSPCTTTLRGINCPVPACMERLEPELVWDALSFVLKKTA